MVRDTDIEAVPDFTWEFDEVVRRIKGAADDIDGDVGSIDHLVRAVQRAEHNATRDLIEATFR